MTDSGSDAGVVSKVLHNMEVISQFICQASHVAQLRYQTKHLCFALIKDKRLQPVKKKDSEDYGMQEKYLNI